MLLLFKFGWLLYLFLDWLLWLGLPILCWRKEVSEHPCHASDVRGKDLRFSEIEYCVNCGFVICGPHYVEAFSLYISFVERSLFKIINGCWILSNVFSTSIEMIIWFLSFVLLRWCITLIDCGYWIIFAFLG